MSNLITKVSGYKFYSKIDLKNAYLQIKVDNKSQKYFVINTHLGLYKYEHLTFNLPFTVVNFQRLVSSIILFRLLFIYPASLFFVVLFFPFVELVYLKG